MKVLLIGNGARENAIYKALVRSRHNPEIVVFGKAKNPGMLSNTVHYEVGDYMNLEKVQEVAKHHNPDFAIVGPDDPIGAGAADALEAVGIKTFAPKKEVARLESSKSFTRELVEKYGIAGNPLFKNFTAQDQNEIRNYIENVLGGNYVIKYDGLLGGKGVKVSGEHLATIDEGVKYAEECIEELGHVVIEEKFIGPEFSLMSFADGHSTVKMPAIQDHKRAFNGDTGPNTGGMGTYSDANHLLPFINQQDINDAEAITNDVLKALKRETGTEFKGIMYGGFMKTANGIKLIEYNARFGDPEAMNALSILETDFVDLSLAIINGELHNIEVRFAPKATVCLYIVPEGYPGATNANDDQRILRLKKKGLGSDLCFSSVDLIEENANEYILQMSTSRALAFTGIADTIEEALEQAKADLGNLEGNIAYRTDIGTKELIQKRIELINSFK
jgi:phosphoribosylamine--glycine ligase